MMANGIPRFAHRSAKRRGRIKVPSTETLPIRKIACRSSALRFISGDQLMVPSSATPLAGSMRKKRRFLPHARSPDRSPPSCFCLRWTPAPGDNVGNLRATAGVPKTDRSSRDRPRRFDKPDKAHPHRSRLSGSRRQNRPAVACGRACLPAANEGGLHLSAAHTDSVSPRHPVFERWRGKLKPTRARDNSDLPFLPGDRAAG